MGETTPVRSWGEPPRPHWLPKTALHRCNSSFKRPTSPISPTLPITTMQ
ncbi:hypothetical protein [Moorena producens]